MFVIHAHILSQILGSVMDGYVGVPWKMYILVCFAGEWGELVEVGKKGT